MVPEKEILKQVRAAVREHARELKALRKNAATMRGSKLTAGFPHVTYVLKKLGAKKVVVSDAGIRAILFENEKPVGTIDFSVDNDTLIFSHFTFSKKTNHL